MLVIPLAYAVWAIGTFFKDKPGASGTLVLGFMAFLAAVIAVGMIRFARASVRTLPSGLIVQNPFRRHVLNWEDIADVQPPGPSLWRAAQIRLNDDRSVAALGLVAGREAWPDRWRRRSDRRLPKRMHSQPAHTDAGPSERVVVRRDEKGSSEQRSVGGASRRLGCRRPGAVAFS